jgi:membrane protein required for colicin V production
LTVDFDTFTQNQQFFNLLFVKVIDIFILLPILWGAFIGYQRGIIIEVISILAFIISVIIGFKTLGVASDWLSPYMTSKVTDRVLPYVVLEQYFSRLCILSIN